MKRLIVTNDFSAAGHLGVGRRADFVIAVEWQLVWGRLPSDAELSGFFGKRKKHRSRLNWQDYQPPHRLEAIGAVGLGLIELCSRFEAIELWMDPRANDQLQLVCLLHHLRAHSEIASRLSLVQAHVPMGGQKPEVSAKWTLPVVKISNDHFELASRAWRAFGSATPQDWFGLLATEFKPAAAASKRRDRTARRAALAPHGPRRDGNADARLHIGMGADRAGGRRS